MTLCVEIYILNQIQCGKPACYVFFCDFGFQLYICQWLILKSLGNLDHVLGLLHRESVLHALLECPLNNVLRKKLINKYFWKSSNTRQYNYGIDNIAKLKC
jgi:hypothetical protein